MFLWGDCPTPWGAEKDREWDLAGERVQAGMKAERERKKKGGEEVESWRHLTDKARKQLGVVGKGKKISRVGAKVWVRPAVIDVGEDDPNVPF